MSAILNVGNRIMNTYVCCSQIRSCKYDDDTEDIFAYHSGTGE